ncbi:hypothetical protein HANVADRAFT_410 [Hanseniaspora valbyensis NRRL Y-1626]|uniref:Uncharacterized protein n=1 Tax=Hanseniaspora valbyensis NRRL Y-1626 TaxID=766949 RepID=A0A1B7TJF2_9ASCO|nr:hypothetical protein HANVADRAFT_410 [Hanseniaspora valbyensis NRRL Y-1626]
MGSNLSAPIPNFAKECSGMNDKFNKCSDQWYKGEFLKGESIENPSLLLKDFKQINEFQEGDLPDDINEFIKENNIKFDLANRGGFDK